MGSSELAAGFDSVVAGPRIGFLYGMPIDRPRGGGTIHGYQLARHLSALGAQLSSWYFDAGETPLVHGYRGRELLRFVREIDCLYLRIEWSNVSSTLSWLKTLRLGALPVIWELNGTPAELQFSESASAIAGIVSRLRRNARACDAAIGVSEEVVDFARTDLRIDNVHCIPNGSDPDLFVPRDDPRSGPLKCAWIGTSQAGWHDLGLLYELAAALVRAGSDIEFHLFGDPKGLPAGPPSNVVIRGEFRYEDLPRQLARCDVGIHFFRKSDPLVVGSPLKLFDYMACGMPVIVNAPGQQARIIEEYGCGWFAEPSVDAMVRQLMTIAAEPEQVSARGRRARTAVLARYNWRANAEGTLAVVRSVLRSRRR